VSRRPSQTESVADITARMARERAAAEKLASGAQLTLEDLHDLSPAATVQALENGQLGDLGAGASRRRSR
jgi:hypothetical protein